MNHNMSFVINMIIHSCVFVNYSPEIRNHRQLTWVSYQRKMMLWFILWYRVIVGHFVLKYWIVIALPCSSATYSPSTNDCRISDMDRHTVAGTEAFAESTEDMYLENNCVDDPVKLCDFQLLENRIMKTVDSVYQVSDTSLNTLNLKRTSSSIVFHPQTILCISFIILISDSILFVKIHFIKTEHKHSINAAFYQ